MQILLSLYIYHIIFNLIITGVPSFHRRMFDNFDPSSVASFDEKKLQSLTTNGSSKLSEQKLRAIIENAKQVLKVKNSQKS